MGRQHAPNKLCALNNDVHLITDSTVCIFLLVTSNVGA